MLKQLEPYTAMIKLGLLGAAVLVVFSLGSWVGCSVGKNSNADIVRDLEKQNSTLTAQLSAVSTAVEESNRQVEANKQFAKEREKMAAAAAEEARKAKKALAAKEKEVADKLKQARKDPDCQALLEMQLCPQLRNY